MTKCLIPAEAEYEGMTLQGYIGKPELSRGNRTFMNYFVNGRYIKSPVITSAIEHAYKSFLMNHRYPFTALLLTIDSSYIDVNVHPTKLEARFTNQEQVYQFIYDTIRDLLKNAVLIPEVSPEPEQKKQPVQTPPVQGAQDTPEPFEKKRLKALPAAEDIFSVNEKTAWESPKKPQQEFVQEKILVPEQKLRFRMIGQVFATYWLVEYESELLIIDQHAAHEKVLYEKLMRRLGSKTGLTQNLAAPVVVTLSGREMDILAEYKDTFCEIGFQFEPFGDKEYIITGVPADFLDLPYRELFLEILDSMMQEGIPDKPELVLDHCATMACKAAVKGNHRLSFAEAEELLNEMLQAEEPYHCPHGRPTTIAMSRQDFEKKFKRIV